MSTSPTDGDPDPVRPLVSAVRPRGGRRPPSGPVAFIEAAGISATVEDHRRRTRDDFVEGLQAIGADIRRARLGSGTATTSADRPGPSPRRNAVAVVGAIVEMTLDWLLDPEPDPVEDLIDDIAHHCRRVMQAIIDETARP